MPELEQEQEQTEIKELKCVALGEDLENIVEFTEPDNSDRISLLERNINDGF